MNLNELMEKILQGVRNIIVSEVITKIDQTKEELNQKIGELRKETIIKIDNINIRIDQTNQRIDYLQTEVNKIYIELSKEIKINTEKLDNKIEGVRKELKTDIEKLDNKIEGVRKELKTDIEKLDNKIEDVRKELNNKIEEVRKELKTDIEKLDIRVENLANKLNEETTRLSLKVDQMNKRVDDLFFQYEYKMNNIQREYKNYIITINKELSEFLYRRLVEEYQKDLATTQDPDCFKNYFLILN